MGQKYAFHTEVTEDGDGLMIALFTIVYHAVSDVAMLGQYLVKLFRYIVILRNDLAVSGYGRIAPAGCVKIFRCNCSWIHVPGNTGINPAVIAHVYFCIGMNEFIIVLVYNVFKFMDPVKNLIFLKSLGS